MGIDVNDIGEVPVVQQTKRQSSTGNGQLLGNAQTNLDNKQSSNAKKEGKKLNPVQEVLVVKCITLFSRTAIQCTVKSVLRDHLKIDKTKVLMENGSLMKVESIAECSPWSILRYF